MNLKYLLCIFLFLILRGISFCQDNVYNNLTLIDRLVDESFTPVSNKLLILGKDNLYMIGIESSSQAGSYLLESFKRKFDGYKLVINEDSDSIDYKIILKNPVINTKYKKIYTDNILGTKKIDREVTVSYDIELTEKKNSSLIYHQNFSKTIRDNFNFDKLGFVEDKRYSFSRADLPEESTLNQILFPALIITASAAAIILFFIIRSK